MRQHYYWPTPQILSHDEPLCIIYCNSNGISQTKLKSFHWLFIKKEKSSWFFWKTTLLKWNTKNKAKKYLIHKLWKLSTLEKNAFLYNTFGLILAFITTNKSRKYWFMRQNSQIISHKLCYYLIYKTEIFYKLNIPWWYSYLEMCVWFKSKRLWVLPSLSQTSAFPLLLNCLSSWN